MKLNILFKTIFIVLIACLASFTYGQTEPNNTKENAFVVNGDMTIIDSVGTLNDTIDHYCFAPDSNVIVKLMFETRDSASSNKFYTSSIRDHLGNAIAQVKDSSSFMAYKMQKYYFNIESKYSDSICRYSLKFITIKDFTPDTTTEYNNDYKHAFPLVKDSIAGDVGYWGDNEDWYSVKFTTDGTYTISLINLMDQMDLGFGSGSLELCSPTGHSLTNFTSISLPKEGDTASRSYSFIADYNYLIKVRSYNNAYDYKLKITSDAQYTSEIWQPGIPYSKEHPDGSSNLSEGNNLLEFKTNHPLGDEIFYDLYIGANINPTTKVLTKSLVGEYTIPDVNWGDTLYWKAIAYTNTSDTTYSPVNLISAQQLSPTPNNLTGLYQGSSSSWGDYDNDGDLDLIMCGYTAESYPYSPKTFLYNNENGNLNIVAHNLENVGNGGVEWGDYDNDGDLDILLTGENENAVDHFIIYNNENGNFSPITIENSYGIEGSCEWGDFDADGDLDILVNSKSSTYSIKIYENNNGSFNELSTSIPQLRYSIAKWGDFDNDNDLDLLISGYSGSYQTTIYKYQEGEYSLHTSLQTMYDHESADWGDFDNDGDLDLIITGRLYSNSTHSTIIYQNDNNTFNSVTTNMKGLNYSSVKWIDYDNDGDLDFVMSGWDENTDYVTKAFINNNNTFTETNMSLMGLYWGDISISDFDNDLDNDILISGKHDYDDFHTLLYKNGSAVPNSKPTAPANINYLLSNDTLTLSWDKATDNENNKVQYDLYLRNENKGKNFFPINFDLNSGFRKIVQDGSIRDTSVSVSNIIRGNYSFYIQAVDNSFTGSSVASGTFSKANSSPVAAKLIQPSNDEVIEGNSVVLKWSSSDHDSDTIFYTINVGPTGAMKTIATDITADSIVVANLLGNENYTWQVTARDDFGGSSKSDIFRFTTIGGENEPNNDMANATCTDRSTSYDAFVGNNADPADYYCFSYPKNCILTITVQNKNISGASNGGLDYIYITNGKEQVTSISSSTISAGQTGTAQLMVNANTKYYIPIKPINLIDYVPYRLDLTVEEYSPSDNYEYNNTKETAYPLFASTVSATVGYWGDYEDWYKINFTSGGSFTVKITNNADPVNILSGLNTTYIYYSTGDNSAGSISRPSDNYSYESSTIIAGPGSSFYIKVAPYDNFSAADYTLEIISEIQELHETFAPTIPIPVSHPDGGTNLQEGTNLLTWNCSHPTNQALLYDLYLSKDTTPTLAATELTSPEYTINEVQWGDTLYWRVVAKTATNDSASSPTFSISAQKFSHLWDNNPFRQTKLSSNDWGDYDGDGDLDLLLSGEIDSWNDIAEIYRNDNGNFIPLNLELPGIRNGVVKWGDYDNDGDLDFMMSGQQTWEQKYYSGIFNNNNGVFTKTEDNIIAVGFGDAEWFDADNDGDLDLLIAGSNNYDITGASTRLYINTKNVFTETITNIPDSWLCNFDVADFDGDGDTDILFSGNDAETMATRIYTNSNGIFSGSEITDAAISANPTWGDGDNDGDLDILISGGVWNGSAVVPYSKVFLNNNGTYEEEPSYIEPFDLSTANWGDYDNDGDLDIVVSGTNNWTDASTMVYRNELSEGNGFVHETWFHGIKSGSASLVDYDNDNDLDVFLSGENYLNDPSSVLVQNNTKIKNTPPNQLASLRTKVTETGLELTWDAATDTETPSTGLSYNLFLRGPDGMVYATMADSITGKRLISQRGPIQGTSITIDTTGFTYGLYSCMVQAIDPAFEGGAWSSKRTFTLSDNPSPIVDLKLPLNNALDVDTLNTQLTWAASDPEGETINYNLYFGTTNPPTLISGNIPEADSTYALGQLPYGVRYYWNVEVIDAFGNKAISETRTFETYKNDAPVVNLIAPDSAQNPAPTTITLEWTATDQDNDLTETKLYFGTTTNPTYEIDVFNTTSLIVDTLRYQVTYYWKIKATDAFGNVTESLVWSFTTGQDQKPNITLVSPANNATDVNVHPVTLTWQGSDDGGNEAITYDLFFGTNNPPTNQRLNKANQTTFTLDTLVSQTDFYWYVKAYDKTGNDSVSGIYHFSSEDINHNFYKLHVTDANNNAIDGAYFYIDIFGARDTSGFTNSNGESGVYYTNRSTVNIEVVKEGYFAYSEDDLTLLQNRTRTIEVELPLLADYNNDANIDISDLNTLVNNWKNEETTYELGPASGSAPNFTVDPDGSIDFEDMMIFVMMWEHKNKKKSATRNIADYSVYENDKQDFKIYYSYEYNESLTQITYKFSATGKGEISATSIKLKYDASLLTYNTYNIDIAEQYQELTLHNHDEEDAYIEINTGILEQNSINGEVELASVTFDIVNNSKANALAKSNYIVYSNNSESKGNTQFIDIENTISVYPNPAKSSISIGFTAHNNTAKVSIIDVTGKTVLFKEITNTENKIDINELPAGIFMISVETDNKVLNTKLIKE